MALPFEKQPKESPKAFAAFSLYLNLGPQRSLATVAQKLAKSEQLMKRWSAKFDWPSRVAAFAAHLATIERQTIEALARENAIAWHTLHEEQRIAEWKARCRALKLAEKMMDRWEKNEGKCGTLEGIARLLELVHKLGRSATGMPTEIKEVKGEINGKLEVEWELALRKVYGVKAEVGSRELEVGTKAVIEAEVVERGKITDRVEPVPTTTEGGR